MKLAWAILIPAVLAAPVADAEADPAPAPAPEPEAAPVDYENYGSYGKIQEPMAALLYTMEETFPNLSTI